MFLNRRASRTATRSTGAAACLRRSGFSLHARLDPHVQRVDGTGRPGPTDRIFRPSGRKSGPQQRYFGTVLFRYGQSNVGPGNRRRRRHHQRVRVRRGRDQQRVFCAVQVTLCYLLLLQLLVGRGR